MIDEAVILAAGMGTRLAAAHADPAPFSKPLLKVGGKTLLGHVLSSCAVAGVRRAVVVTGFRADIVRDECARWDTVEVEVVHNERWHEPNGLSVAAARHAVGSEFLLMMSDHLFDPEILSELGRSRGQPGVTLAVDTRIDSILDLDDATKVRRDGKRIVAIGKHLVEFDAVDCGLFRCTRDIFPAIDEASRAKPPSLSDGLSVLLRDNSFTSMDVGGRWWQDVDTPEMADAASQMLERNSP